MLTSKIAPCPASNHPFLMTKLSWREHDSLGGSRLGCGQSSYWRDLQKHGNDLAIADDRVVFVLRTEVKQPGMGFSRGEAGRPCGNARAAGRAVDVAREPVGLPSGINRHQHHAVGLVVRTRPQPGGKLRLPGVQSIQENDVLNARVTEPHKNGAIGSTVAYHHQRSVRQGKGGAVFNGAQQIRPATSRATSSPFDWGASMAMKSALRPLSRNCTAS